jgi:spore maturation protein CgeB
MKKFDLQHYDGVLASGRVVRDLYLWRGWARAAWTWHQAADTRVFRPRLGCERQGDVVWIGNWGDEERSEELREFLLDPVRDLRLRARVHGVRYPASVLEELRAADIEYAGWIPNHEVPEVFACHALTVHVPRRPYTLLLPGIPSIRVFEALACGIPLVCAPWRDDEALFEPGTDYLVARDGDSMRRHVLDLLRDSEMARDLAAHGLATVRARHTCAHRVRELYGILRELGMRGVRIPPVPSLEEA